MVPSPRESGLAQDTVRRADRSKKPVVLMILDGYGLNERKDGNAVALARTHVMD